MFDIDTDCEAPIGRFRCLPRTYLVARVRETAERLEPGQSFFVPLPDGDNLKGLAASVHGAIAVLRKNLVGKRLSAAQTLCDEKAGVPGVRVGCLEA